MYLSVVMLYEINKTGAVQTYVAFFHCMSKVSVCCIVYEFILVQGNLAKKYIKKSSRTAKAHVRILANWAWWNNY